MSDCRFELGAALMCNLGPSGWKLGRIIALHYREEHWPAERVAPYQVALEDDHALIFVPVDDARYCREPTQEDLKIARRMDALAALPPGVEARRPELSGGLHCSGVAGIDPDDEEAGYRSGRCGCCHSCPQNWSNVELYSEHYRCAARNGLKVTRRSVNLGTLRVGDSLLHPAGEDLPSQGGFMQCPTLVRLPPGVRFSDDGALAGELRFDPHRDATYNVEFVAVSTADWQDDTVGVVRLEISFVVEGNEAPQGFDVGAFTRRQQQASATAERAVSELVRIWQEWEREELSHRDTCDTMCAELRRLRELLERHPRLDGGRWWGRLGGFHMNVHKLLENTLFECELYLGHALTFGSSEVRGLAEQNLEGCYDKRRLEAARFMWNRGAKQMMRGEWEAAAETMRLAAAKKEGWGWAVNYGDIWLAEAAARLVRAAEFSARSPDGARYLADAETLLKKCVERAEESRAFGPSGHPWATEVDAALDSFRSLRQSGADTSTWLEAFKLRTAYWCAQILGGAFPFPPKLRPRLEEADALVQRLPKHNA